MEKGSPPFVLTPPFRTHALVLAVLALVCTRIPLFNYLGFEFSALMAVAGGFSAGLLTLAILRGNPASTPLMTAFGTAAQASLSLLVVPLAIISLNALLVRNCSFSDGLMFYVLGPVPAVLFTAALAVFLHAAVDRWRRVLFVVAIAAILAQILVVTMTSPRIFAFNPVLGFFPGITYDESLSVGPRLTLYRLTTLIAAAVLVVAGEMLRRSRASRVSVLPAGTRAERTIVAAGIVVLAFAWLFSDRLGFSSSEESIRRELSGELTTEHFVLVFPPDLDPARAAELAREHEFLFADLARQLRIRGGTKITSYLYASPEQKGRLIGAAGTNIAKPWLAQMHINLGDAARALRHELVHILAGEFGLPVLRIGVTSGLIEGLATAAERVQYGETLHRLAAQILAAGIEPDMESLFSLTGFFKGHGGTSYVLAGSFCRYLIDHYGMRRFRWVYRTGSFESFYNRRFDVLVGEWRRFISQPQPTQEERTRAVYYFRRPSIFARECARVIAEVNETTRELIRGRKWEEAVASSRRSLDLSRSPEAVIQHVHALVRAGRNEEAIGVGTEALDDSTIAHSLLPLYLTLGDAMWASGHRAAAKRLYESLYSVHLSPSYDEACALRLEALGQRDRAALRELVTGQTDDSLRLAVLLERVRRDPSPLLSYLTGRELAGAGRKTEALEVLLRTPLLKVAVLDHLRMRRTARLLFDEGRYQEAKAYFWESLNFTARESDRIEIEEWLRRCEWTIG